MRSAQFHDGIYIYLERLPVPISLFRTALISSEYVRLTSDIKWPLYRCFAGRSWTIGHMDIHLLQTSLSYSVCQKE